MESIFAIANRTHRKDNLHLRIGFPQVLNGLKKINGTLIHGEQALAVQSRGTLLAIVYDLTRFLQHINMVGAQGEDCDIRLPAHFQGAGNGVQDGGRVIHYAIGIHRGPEPLFLKSATHIVGKTTADKEHFLTGRNLKRSLANLYLRSEFHLSTAFRNIISWSNANFGKSSSENHRALLASSEPLTASAAGSST